MSDTYIPIEERRCDYRHCNKIIPQEMRSDSKFCCANHGAKERYLLKKDNKIKTSTQKAIDKSYKVIKDFFEKGQRKFPKIVLECSEFDFKVMTGLTEINKTTGKIVYNIYEYELVVLGNQCIIRKTEL